MTQTSLASRAIDAMADEPTRAEVREALLNYLDTDTIWCVVLRFRTAWMRLT